jgi:hypothetical protein
MDLELLLYAIVMLTAGIMYIATTSIATECANDSEMANATKNYKTDHPGNFSFIVFNLICAIFITLGGIIGIFLASTKTKNL